MIIEEAQRSNQNYVANRWLGERVTPISLIHAHFNVFGFRVGNVAYCTDVNKIPKESWPLLEGVRVLVLDALRHKPHPGHFCLDEAVEVMRGF